MALLFRKQSVLWLLNISVTVLVCWILADLFSFTDNQEPLSPHLSSPARASANHNIIYQQDFPAARNNISQLRRRRKRRSRHCRFPVPSLHKYVQFTCGHGDFVSVVKSVCKTQLGNQLSSYAALLYFTLKFGYHAFLDPVQTREIGMVFKKNKLSIGTFDFYKCGCVPGAQHWTRPLHLHRTGVAVRLDKDWNPREHAENHLVGLGPHSVPLFLFKEILPQMRQEMVFKDRLMVMAMDMIKAVTQDITQEPVLVGVHVRRGDKLRVWRESGVVKNSLGRYEGRYFRYSMNLMRQRYNSLSRKVVFIVTSDNTGWCKHKLGNQPDTFFSSDFTKAPTKGPTSLGLDLAVLSLANHTIMDYGTFGLWAGLLAGGSILAPTGYTIGAAMTPDMVWWKVANMSTVELIDINHLPDEGD